MTTWRRLAALLILAGTSSASWAHEVRPGYLDIREVEPGTYDVLWKVPARGEMRLALYARLPRECATTRETASSDGAVFITRWRAVCPGGLVGRSLTIEGLPATRTDVLVRIAHLGGVTQTSRLTPDAPTLDVVAVPTAMEVARTYFSLGIEHILLGVDHLLFVLGLLLLVGNWKRLVVTVTAFTVAHSITLAAATLGFVDVPQAPVEAVIALSVMFVAAEVLRTTQGRTSLTARAPWLVAFVFGLLHGLGFAGALREVGLPQADIPVALLFFNLGVEVGQLAFIAVVLAVLTLVRRLAAVSRAGAGTTAAAGPGTAVQGALWVNPLLRTALAYLIGCTAAFWVIDRMSGFV